MVIKTASPGIVIQEVDLTKGTSDAITTNIGAFAGPVDLRLNETEILLSSDLFLLTECLSHDGNTTNTLSCG